MVVYLENGHKEVLCSTYALCQSRVNVRGFCYTWQVCCC